MSLKLLVSDYIFFIPIMLNISIHLIIFFKNCSFNINKKNSWDKSISIRNVITRQNPSFLIKTYMLFNFMLFIFLITFSNYSGTFWWSHFKLNNFNLYIFILITALNNYFLYIADKHVKITNNYKIDYVYSIINIMIFTPLIFISNTLFTFFFLIELSSCSIFYKFITSRMNFNKKNNQNKFFSIYSKNYINILFFQYWSSFFSSVLIIFSIYVMYSITGTTEWAVSNYIIISNKQLNYIDNNFIFILLSVTMLLGFFIKLGIAPIQLYKIEIYKGLPILSVLFYTIFYFINFFLFFALIITNYISALISFYWIILTLLIIFGSTYVIILMFDINLFKTFLAYSTIINSLLFILISLSIIF